MAEALPLSDVELRILESLAQHGVRFMIVGLSAGSARAPVVTEDVVLWVENLGDANFRSALLAVGAGYAPPFGYNPLMILWAGRGTIRFGLSHERSRQLCQRVSSRPRIRLGSQKIKILSLERIVAKEAANRPKDKLVLPVLRDTLRTRNAKR